MKKLRQLLTALTLLCCVVANAYDFEVNGIYYDITNATTKTVEVADCSEEYTAYVNIPESVTYNGTSYSVTSIGSFAFYNCSGITGITIPNSVTSIGEGAFQYCSGLTGIEIPKSVTSIGDYAFHDCSGLTGIEIPKSVTSIGEYAFSGCSGLTNVVIGNSVTSIGEWAFRGCSSLTSITIPNSVTSIGVAAFQGCSRLASITIPNSVTSIGAAAFQGCSRLASITIPNSVTSIGQNAFYGCSGLTSITIPNGITEILSSTFANCSSLTSITIPNSVTSIGSDAFKGCVQLKTVVNYSNLEFSIGSESYGYVAYNADRIINSINEESELSNDKQYVISQPNHSKGVTSWALQSGGNKLKSNVELGISVNWNDSRQKFAILSPNKNGSYYLYHVAEKKFVKKDGSLSKTPVDKIYFNNGGYARTFILYFDTNNYLNVNGSQNLVINNYKTPDGGNSCAILSVDEFDLTKANLEPYMFLNVNGVNTLMGYWGDETNIVLPDSYNGESYAIAADAFKNNTAITRITIPSGVTRIGDRAFEGCENLKTVINYSDLELTKGETNNGYVAFYATEINVCEQVGEFVFEKNTKTLLAYLGDDTEVVLPDNYYGGNYVIGKEAFLGKNISSITIPTSVTGIKESAFKNCSSLASITIPNSVTNIGNSAFEGCSVLNTVINLSNLNFSKGSDTYGKIACNAKRLINAPDGCIKDDFVYSTIDGECFLLGYLGNDTHVVLPDKYNGASYSIGKNAFANCSNILSVTISANIDAIDGNAFSGCDNIAKVFWLPNTPPAGYTALNGKINYVANNKYTNLNNIVVTSNLSSKFEVDGMVFIPTNLAARQCCVVDDLNDNLANIVVKDTVLYRNVALAVTDIMPYAFYNNDVVKTLTLNNSGIVGEQAFYDNDALTTLTLNNCSDIGASAFCGNDALVALTFNNKGSIGASAFEDCISLSSVNIPQEITSIGDHAFKGCKELTTARIEDRTTVLPLGKRLFDGTVLQDLYIGAKINYINEVSHEASPFCENKTLKNVVITDIEDHIYDYEFYNCSALETVTVGDGVESIGKWAFSGCYSLSEFVFGSNVSSIGEEAFSDCTGMTKITGRAVLPPVCGSQALDDINKWECTLYVPSRNLKQYQNAEQWNQFLLIENLETTDNYVTYMLEDEVYKVLLLTPGNRIIAPYVADKEDGTPFSGWEMDEYIPSKADANGIELKLNESMLYTNAPNTMTAWGEEFKDWTVLLDDNVETFFHSEYGGRQTLDGLDHYIRVDVGEEMSIGKFTFTYTTRYNNNSVSPKTMLVEGSNSADGIYTEIATLTNLPGDANTVYTSQELGSDDIRYRYIRYRVTENSGGGMDNGHPYFAMSEFDMQGLLKNEGTASMIDYPVMPDRDITIKGYYTKSVYALTYMVDGDVYKTYTLQQGDVIPTVDTPQKKGFVFSGWSEMPATMPAEDVTITGTFDLEKTGITDVTEISNYCLYHITQPHYSQGRTAWIVAADGKVLKTNGELSAEVDPYDARQQFAIISKDGRSHYLYHVAKGKFVNKDGSLSATPKDVVLFKSGAYTRTFVMYFDNTHYINIDENQQLVVNANGTANGGNSCSIVAVTDTFDPAEALEKFDIPEDTGVRTIYYISTQRGSWAVETGGNAIVSNSDLGIVAEQNDVRQQFAVLSINDVTHYLYHPAEKKFVNKDGSLSAKPADAIHFKDGKFDDTYVVYFDDTHYINLGGSSQMLIDYWNTPDEGNSCTFVSVGTFDATAALAAIDKFETAIEDVECEEKETVIYDLQGRRIKEITAPGIYVINGKKTIVK